MDGSQPSPRRLVVGLHAAAVGIAWFVVGLPLAILWVTYPDHAATLVRVLPDWSLAPIALVTLVIACPLLWPVWLALGWLELGLLTESPTRPHALRRIVTAQATGWLIVAAATVPWLASSFGADTSPILRWVWLGPGGVAAIHFAVARSIPKGAV